MSSSRKTDRQGSPPAKGDSHRGSLQKQSSTSGTQKQETSGNLQKQGSKSGLQKQSSAMLQSLGSVTLQDSAWASQSNLSVHAASGFISTPAEVAGEELNKVIEYLDEIYDDDRLIEYIENRTEKEGQSPISFFDSVDQGRYLGKTGASTYAPVSNNYSPVYVRGTRVLDVNATWSETARKKREDELAAVKKADEKLDENNDYPLIGEQKDKKPGKPVSTGGNVDIKPRGSVLTMQGLRQAEDLLRGKERKPERDGSSKQDKKNSSRLDRQEQHDLLRAQRAKERQDRSDSPVRSYAVEVELPPEKSLAAPAPRLEKNIFGNKKPKTEESKPTTPSQKKYKTEIHYYSLDNKHNREIEEKKRDDYIKNVKEGDPSIIDMTKVKGMNQALDEKERLQAQKNATTSGVGAAAVKTSGSPAAATKDGKEKKENKKKKKTKHQKSFSMVSPKKDVSDRIKVPKNSEIHQTQIGKAFYLDHGITVEGHQVVSESHFEETSKEYHSREMLNKDISEAGGGPQHSFSKEMGLGIVEAEGHSDSYLRGENDDDEDRNSVIDSSEEDGGSLQFSMKSRFLREWEVSKQNGEAILDSRHSNRKYSNANYDSGGLKLPPVTHFSPSKIISGLGNQRFIGIKNVERYHEERIVEIEENAELQAAQAAANAEAAAIINATNGRPTTPSGGKQPGSKAAKGLQSGKTGLKEESGGGSTKEGEKKASSSFASQKTVVDGSSTTSLGSPVSKLAPYRGLTLSPMDLSKAGLNSYIQAGSKSDSPKKTKRKTSRSRSPTRLMQRTGSPDREEYYRYCSPSRLQYLDSPLGTVPAAFQPGTNGPIGVLSQHAAAALGPNLAGTGKDLQSLGGTKTRKTRPGKLKIIMQQKYAADGLGVPADLNLLNKEQFEKKAIEMNAKLQKIMSGEQFMSHLLAGGTQRKSEKKEEIGDPRGQSPMARHIYSLKAVLSEIPDPTGEFSNKYERLVYFRYHKKVVGAMPPLLKTDLCPSDYLLSRLAQNTVGAVDRNRSPDYIRKYSPRNRKKHYKNVNAVWENKVGAYKLLRRRMRRDRDNRILTALARKNFHHPFLGSSRNVPGTAYIASEPPEDEMTEEEIGNKATSRILSLITILNFLEECAEIVDPESEDEDDETEEGRTTTGGTEGGVEGPDGTFITALEDTVDADGEAGESIDNRSTSPKGRKSMFSKETLHRSRSRRMARSSIRGMANSTMKPTPGFQIYLRRLNPGGSRPGSSNAKTKKKDMQNKSSALRAICLMQRRAMQQAFKRFIILQRYLKEWATKQKLHRSARIVFSMMSLWAEDARTQKFILIFRAFYQNVKKIQRFWRRIWRKNVRLWKKLCLDAKVYERKHHLYGWMARNGKAVPTEEQVDGQMIDDADRFQYIRIEMRARRYVLLTAIRRWEENFREYQKEVGEWRIARQATIVLQKVQSPYREFMYDVPPNMVPQMPPCPSHLPKQRDYPSLVARYLHIHGSIQAQRIKEKAAEAQARQEEHRPGLATSQAAIGHLSTSTPHQTLHQGQHPVGHQSHGRRALERGPLQKLSREKEAHLVLQTIL